MKKIYKMLLKMILLIFFGFIKILVIILWYFEEMFFYKYKFKDWNDKGKNFYCLFFRYWCIMLNNNFFLLKDNFNMKIEYFFLEIK